MAQVYADRCCEYTGTTGTGTVTTTGVAPAQFQTLANGIGTGNTTDYCLLSGNGTDWETGSGTVTVSGGMTTLSRDAVYESSNSGSKISLSGTSTVFCTVTARPAGFFVRGETALYLNANTAALTINAWSNVSWNAAYRDTFSTWASSPHPDRIVVPNGVNEARVTVHLTWQNSGTSIRYMQILYHHVASGTEKNFPGGDIRGAFNESLSSTITPWRPVYPGGDYLYIQADPATNNIYLQGAADPDGIFGGATYIQVEWR